MAKRLYLASGQNVGGYKGNNGESLNLPAVEMYDFLNLMLIETDFAT